MDESSMNQNRRSRRSNVLLAASIETSGASLPVKLRNLSTEGALVEGDDLPLEGSEVLFKRNDLSVNSRVAWVHGKHAGVAFRGPIAQEDVLRNIPKPKHRAHVDFRRPGLAVRQLTPEEQRLAATWAWRPGYDLPGE
jgi:PilZ domain